jgi:hypothetical protein
MAKVDLTMRHTFQAEQVFEKKNGELTVVGAAADGVIYVVARRKKGNNMSNVASFCLTDKELETSLATLKGEKRK